MDLTAFSEKIQQLREQIRRVIIGQHQAVDLILTAVLANGHVLIEGVPGVAKTLTARLVARLVNAGFSRIQFTPDLMPSDVLGTTVFNMKDSEFHFHEGPIFSDIVLVDEINRAPAKTQAALFEVMEEKQVSIDGTTYKMDDLFTIIATMQLHQGNLDFVELSDIEPVITKEELTYLRRNINKVYIDPTLVNYIVNIVQQTRTSKRVLLGASPRASIAMMQSAKAYAVLQGRDFVIPEDVRFVTPSILQHRMIITAEAEMEGFTPLKVTQRLIDKVEVPK